MLDTGLLFSGLAERGFETFCGVPCSYLKPLINGAINRGQYVAAVNEGDAVATATGYALAGKRAAVLMQNSGLTNTVSPLTSLNHTFRIGVLGFVSLRGEPGISDEPQHELMGVITEKLLELMAVEWAYLTTDDSELSAQLDAASEVLDSGRSFFFVVKKDTMAPVKLEVDPRQGGLPVVDLVRSVAAAENPGRRVPLEKLAALKNGRTVFLASTGFAGRELYEVEDYAGNFYMVGSMGCVSAIGLGIALARPDLRVVIVDGDGALLMRMGNLATNGYYHPANILHVLFDNNAHESTGGQFTISHAVDFPAIAAASGYPRVRAAATVAEFSAFLAEWGQDPCLTFIRMPVMRDPGKKLVRPTIKPFEVADRLRDFIGSVQG